MRKAKGSKLKAEGKRRAKTLVRVTKPVVAGDSVTFGMGGREVTFVFGSGPGQVPMGRTARSTVRNLARALNQDGTLGRFGAEGNALVDLSSRALVEVGGAA